ncbi:hypothetical protein V6N13_119685 [Hibiscus sabdariffa]|uniref:Aminotransferase class I/classII large domain-containing protein n=1 Tax=Hibiscus sabdariffa TaxID=183260 RepID=A0ABR2E207_9ROSI
MGSFGMLARRVVETEMPVIVQDFKYSFNSQIWIQQLIRGAKNVVSLAQGVVHWKPPQQALDKVKKLVEEPSVSCYGADEGLPELREALTRKLRQENNLNKSSMMVTAEANQVTKILVGPSNPETLYPDADWLEKTLLETNPVPKLVSVVNPGNPSGTYIPEPLLKIQNNFFFSSSFSLNRGSQTYAKNAGCWIVVDNTYEYFMYDGLEHSYLEGDHIVDIFSFSKAYGMMGWRVGYIAYPTEVEGLATQPLKVQDNIPICASLMADRLKRGLEELVKHGLVQ